MIAPADFSSPLGLALPSAIDVDQSDTLAALGHAGGSVIVDLDCPYFGSPSGSTLEEVTRLQWNPIKGQALAVMALEGFQIVDASRQALLGSIAKKQLREPSLVDLKWSEGSRDILATLASSGSFCIWDVRQRSMPGKTQMVHPTTLAGAANRLAWAPFEKESKLAVSKGKYVELWDLRRSDRPVTHVQCDSQKVVDLSWSRNGEYLMAFGFSGALTMLAVDQCFAAEKAETIGLEAPALGDAPQELTPIRTWNYGFPIGASGFSRNLNFALAAVQLSPLLTLSDPQSLPQWATPSTSVHVGQLTSNGEDLEFSQADSIPEEHTIKALTWCSRGVDPQLLGFTSEGNLIGHTFPPQALPRPEETHKTLFGSLSSLFRASKEAKAAESKAGDTDAAVDDTSSAQGASEPSEHKSEGSVTDVREEEVAAEEVKNQRIESQREDTEGATASETSVVENQSPSGDGQPPSVEETEPIAEPTTGMGKSDGDSAAPTASQEAIKSADDSAGVTPVEAEPVESPATAEQATGVAETVPVPTKNGFPSSSDLQLGEQTSTTLLPPSRMGEGNQVAEEAAAKRSRSDSENIGFDIDSNPEEEGQDSGFVGKVEADAAAASTSAAAAETGTDAAADVDQTEAMPPRKKTPPPLPVPANEHKGEDAVPSQPSPQPAASPVVDADRGIVFSEVKNVEAVKALRVPFPRLCGASFGPSGQLAVFQNVTLVLSKEGGTDGSHKLTSSALVNVHSFSHNSINRAINSAAAHTFKAPSAHKGVTYDVKSGLWLGSVRYGSLRVGRTYRDFVFALRRDLYRGRSVITDGDTGVEDHRSGGEDSADDSREKMVPWDTWRLSDSDNNDSEDDGPRRTEQHLQGPSAAPKPLGRKYSSSGESQSSGGEGFDDATTVNSRSTWRKDPSRSSKHSTASQSTVSTKSVASKRGKSLQKKRHKALPISDPNATFEDPSIMARLYGSDDEAEGSGRPRSTMVDESRDNSSSDEFTAREFFGAEEGKLAPWEDEFYEEQEEVTEHWQWLREEQGPEASPYPLAASVADLADDVVKRRGILLERADSTGSRDAMPDEPPAASHGRRKKKHPKQSKHQKPQKHRRRDGRGVPKARKGNRKKSAKGKKGSGEALTADDRLSLERLQDIGPSEVDDQELLKVHTQVMAEARGDIRIIPLCSTWVPAFTGKSYSQLANEWFLGFPKDDLDAHSDVARLVSHPSAPVTQPETDSTLPVPAATVHSSRSFAARAGLLAFALATEESRSEPELLPFICTANGIMSAELGASKASEIWLLAAIASEVFVSCSAGNGIIANEAGLWFHHPLGARLLKRLVRILEHEDDVQLLASILAVFSHEQPAKRQSFSGPILPLIKSHSLANLVEVTAGAPSSWGAAESKRSEKPVKANLTAFLRRRSSFTPQKAPNSPVRRRLGSTIGGVDQTNSSGDQPQAETRTPKASPGTASWSSHDTMMDVTLPPAVSPMKRRQLTTVAISPSKSLKIRAALQGGLGVLAAAGVAQGSSAKAAAGAEARSVPTGGFLQRLGGAGAVPHTASHPALARLRESHGISSTSTLDKSVHSDSSDPPSAFGSQSSLQNGGGFDSSGWRIGATPPPSPDVAKEEAAADFPASGSLHSIREERAHVNAATSPHLQEAQPPATVFTPSHIRTAISSPRLRPHPVRARLQSSLHSSSFRLADLKSMRSPLAGITGEPSMNAAKQSPAYHSESSFTSVSERSNTEDDQAPKDTTPDARVVAALSAAQKSWPPLTWLSLKHTESEHSPTTIPTPVKPKRQKPKPTKRVVLVEVPVASSPARNSNSSILPAEMEEKKSLYAARYAELLTTWGAVHARHMLHRRLNLQDEDWLSFSNNKDGARISSLQQTCCHCGNPVEKKGYCKQCESFGMTCFLCETAVRGVITICPLCGHGGHLSCMQTWFQEEQECCTGCSCECLHSKELLAELALSQANP